MPRETRGTAAEGTETPLACPLWLHPLVTTGNEEHAGPPPPHSVLPLVDVRAGRSTALPSRACVAGLTG